MNPRWKQFLSDLRKVSLTALTPLLVLAASFLLAACGTGASRASDGPVYEQEYQGGLPVDGAVEQETPNGGYRTVVGNPVVIVNGGVEPESLLPYGGGEEGLRQAEDESPNYSPSL
jgi:hypothetical protein